MLRYKQLNNKTSMLLIALTGVQFAMAQTVTDRLRAVGDHYRSLKNYSMNVSVDMYTAENTGTAARHMNGYIHASGKLTRTLFDGKENIVGNDFVLVADHTNRAVYYAPQKQLTKKNMADGPGTLDSAYLSRYTVTGKAISETVLECRLLPKKSDEFKSMTIKIDTQNRTLREITYLYASPVKYPKVIIRYTDFNPAWQPDGEHYTEKEFLAGRRKDARLQTAFSAYQLINSFTYDPKKNLIEQ